MPAPRDHPPLRSVTVLIRLTVEEHRTLVAAGRRAGLGLGPWLRSLGMREANPPESTQRELTHGGERP